MDKPGKTFKNRSGAIVGRYRIESFERCDKWDVGSHHWEVARFYFRGIYDDNNASRGRIRVFLCSDVTIRFSNGFLSTSDGFSLRIPTRLGPRAENHILRQAQTILSLRGLGAVYMPWRDGIDNYGLDLL